MIPINTDRPLRTTTIITPALILVNCFIALIMAVDPEWNKWFLDNWMLNPATPRLWQFISYQFLHGGIMHLLGNMLFLWVFGQCVEDRLGKVAFLCFYLAGGIIAGISHTLTSVAPVIGASGAVSAVTGAFLVLFPYTRIRILWLFILITIFEIPSLWFIGFSFAKDIFFQIKGQGNVAYMAHIAGNIFGAGVGLSLLLSRLLPREPYDLMTLLSQWNRRRQFRAAINSGSSPWTGAKPGKSHVFKKSDKPDNQIITPTNYEKPNGDSHSNYPTKATKDTAKSLSSAQHILESEERSTISELIELQEIPEAAKRYSEHLAIHTDMVLSQSNQLLIANQLFRDKSYEKAAQAYRLFLKAYPAGDATGQVRLLLGLTLVRYLNLFEEARDILSVAIAKIHSESDKQLAQQLLQEANN